MTDSWPPSCLWHGTICPPDKSATDSVCKRDYKTQRKLPPTGTSPPNTHGPRPTLEMCTNTRMCPGLHGTRGTEKRQPMGVPPDSGCVVSFFEAWTDNGLVWDLQRNWFLNKWFLKVKRNVPSMSILSILSSVLMIVESMFVRFFFKTRGKWNREQEKGLLYTDNVPSKWPNTRTFLLLLVRSLVLDLSHDVLNFQPQFLRKGSDAKAEWGQHSQALANSWSSHTHTYAHTQTSAWPQGWYSLVHTFAFFWNGGPLKTYFTML